MSHIVVYRAEDGSSVYEMCSGLDAAVVVAERVRNVDGIEAPEIYELTPVPYDFKPYFRVEVAQPQADLSSIASAPSTLESADQDDERDPRLGASAVFGSGTAVAAAAAEDATLTEAAAEVEAAEDAWQTAADSAGDAGTDDAGGDSTSADADTPTVTDEAAGSHEPSIPEDLSDLPPPPSAETLAADAPEPDAEPADEPDPMVSVRRGLFGR